MPNFQGTDSITVQPNTAAMPYTFTFTVCSSVIANDGQLPYGTNISAITVTAHTSDGTADTDLINGTPSVAANVVTVALDYPTTNGAGTYHLTFVYTLDSGAKDEADFNRVHVKDK